MRSRNERPLRLRVGDALESVISEWLWDSKVAFAVMTILNGPNFQVTIVAASFLLLR